MFPIKEQPFLHMNNFWITRNYFWEERWLTWSNRKAAQFFVCGHSLYSRRPKSAVLPKLVSLVGKVESCLLTSFRKEWVGLAVYEGGPKIRLAGLYSNTEWLHLLATIKVARFHLLYAVSGKSRNIALSIRYILPFPPKTIFFFHLLIGHIIHLDSIRLNLHIFVVVINLSAPLALDVSHFFSCVTRKILYQRSFTWWLPHTLWLLSLSVGFSFTVLMGSSLSDVRFSHCCASPNAPQWQRLDGCTLRVVPDRLNLTRSKLGKLLQSNSKRNPQLVLVAKKVHF